MAHSMTTCLICSEVGHFMGNGWDVNDLARATGTTAAKVSAHLGKYMPETRRWWAVNDKEGAR